MHHLAICIKNSLYFSGTPGVGKSLMSRMLSEKTGLKWLDVSKLAIENECLDEYDEVYQCSVLDEDKVIIIFCYCVDIFYIKIYSNF